MASGKREKIMMESTGTNEKGKPTKYFYTTYKNKQNTAEKIELMKFDPRAVVEGKKGVHVLFKEKKLPK
ncbi:MAG: 50S ribosomal protein L33 [Gammaproteobacteria bacterium RIFCSPHIGHO2_12_FULL_45_9]|nr:MAG: 50S ribosomal protein L33 [Gammaproteobacteria bacterium RIFCSPHIGHO2_12_FULL_45_9]